MATKSKQSKFDLTRVTMLKVSDLLPYANNARTHTDEQVAQVAASIQEFGWTNPLIVHNNTVVAGHARLAAARKLGMDEVPVIDRSDMSEAQWKAYVLADNRLAQNAGWDEGLLKVELEGLQGLDFDLDLLGFDSKEIDALLQPDPVEGLTDPDEVPEDVEPVTQPGDLWELGEHRLLCGDATKAEDVERVLDGQRFNYVFTSPPYGIDLEYEKGDSLDELAALLKSVFVRCDEFAARDAYMTFNYADVYRPGDSGFTPMTPYYHEPLAGLGWLLRGNRIWFKPFGRLALAYGTSTTMNLREWEYVQTWRKQRGKEKLRAHGVTLRGVWKTFGSDAILDDWKKGDETTDKAIHQAAFPVVLPTVGIRAYTDENGLVYEPFSGSGTTIIACQRERRRCAAVEIDPQYVDVAVTRWENFTGKKAVRHAAT